MMVDNYYKIKAMLEKKLQEELNRYRAINKYGTKMIMEQDAPALDAPVDDLPPADPALAPALDAPAGDMPPLPDAGADMPPVDGMEREECDLVTGECYTIREKDGIVERINKRYITNDGRQLLQY